MRWDWGSGMYVPDVLVGIDRDWLGAASCFTPDDKSIFRRALGACRDVPMLTYSSFYARLQVGIL
jgi:hypothetical protein